MSSGEVHIEADVEAGVEESSAPGKLRSVFMGTPELAVPTLRALHDLTQCELVVTQPDRPAGRGRKLAPPPVKVAAEELGLPVWQPEPLRGHEDDERFAVDLIVVMAYGEILRPALLARPRWECVNVHLSLLPRWRGASPLQAALAAGDAETGVTIMRMVKGLMQGQCFVPTPYRWTSTRPCRGYTMP